MIDRKYRRENNVAFTQIKWLFQTIFEAMTLIHKKVFTIGDMRAEDIAIHSGVNMRIFNVNCWGLNRPDLGMVFDSSARREVGKNIPYLQEEDWRYFFDLKEKCLLEEKKLCGIF